MIEYLNLYYFIFFFGGIAFCAGLYFLLRKKSQTFIYRTLLTLLLINFALHFLKQFFSPYSDSGNFPYFLRKSTLENICALNVVLFPWFFLSKGKNCKDYMYYIGAIGALGATLTPTEAVGKAVLNFDTLRFYFCHYVLYTVPVLMVIFGIHKLNYRRLYKVPLFFFCMLAIILLNDIIMIGAGFFTDSVTGKTLGYNELFYENLRNASFIYGPPGHFDGFAVKIARALTLPLFTTIPLGERAGQVFFWPIIWLIIPIYILAFTLGILITMPFDFKRMKDDFISLMRKIKDKTEKKKNEDEDQVTDNK